MSRLTNYNGTEAANLALGQAGVDYFSGNLATVTPGGGSVRWVSVLILADGGSSLVLTPEVGDEITITAAEQDDLIGVSISGPWASITGNGSGGKVVCYRG